jgi:hypothetical protein
MELCRRFYQSGFVSWLHSSQLVLASDIAALRDVIETQLDKPVILDVSLRLVQ